MAENAKDKLIYSGACRFCGQIATSIYAFETQDAADDWATSQCRCEAGEDAREYETNIKAAHEAVDRLFGENAGEAGLLPVSERAQLFLHDCVDLAGKGTFRNISVTLPRGDKAKIASKDLGKIKINRSCTTSYTLEN